MHGRIFIIDTKEDMQKRGYFYEAPWEDYEMIKFIPGCDYVVEQEESSLESDYRWFASAYNLEFGPGKDVEIQEVELDNEKFTVAQVKVKPLIEALKKEKNSRLKKIKEELKKPDPDMWKIHYTAWTDSGFWFVYPGYGFGPEMELLEWLEREKTEKVYITEVYDYHI